MSYTPERGELCERCEETWTNQGYVWFDDWYECEFITEYKGQAIYAAEGWEGVLILNCDIKRIKFRKIEDVT